MRTSTKYELTLGDVPCFSAYFLDHFCWTDLLLIEVFKIANPTV